MKHQHNGTGTFQRSKQRFSKEIGGGMVNGATDLRKNYGAQKLESARATLAQAHIHGARQYADMTDGYVRANTWKALGIAAAGGVLIGILLARR